ncbi:hypothetical protein, partial [Oleiphilus sp. HI0061]
MIKLLSITILASLLSSCASSYFNVSKNTPKSESAILYTYSEGQRAGTIYTVLLKSINGEKLSGKSKRWLYVKPGEYEIEVTSHKYNEGAYIAGAIAGGVAGGAMGASVDTGAIVASSEAYAEMERTRVEDNNIIARL